MPTASSLSVIITSTEVGLAGNSPEGSGSPSITVNVSSSTSASFVVGMIPMPHSQPFWIVMSVIDSKSSGSAVPAVSVTGIVTSRKGSRNWLVRFALTHTSSPSAIGLGMTDRLTPTSLSLISTMYPWMTS